MIRRMKRGWGWAGEEKYLYRRGMGQEGGGPLRAMTGPDAGGPGRGKPILRRAAPYREDPPAGSGEPRAEGGMGICPPYS